MAAEFVNSWSNSTASGSVIDCFPTGMTPGNVMLVFISKDDDVAPTAVYSGDTSETIPNPTELYSFESNNAIWIWCGYKTVTNASETIRASGDSEAWAMTVIEVSGADISTITQGTQWTEGNATSINVSGHSPGAGGIVFAHAAADRARSWNATTNLDNGYTIVEETTVGAAGGISHTVGYFEGSSIGADSAVITAADQMAACSLHMEAADTGTTVDVTPGKDSLSITSYAPEVDIPFDATVGKDALSITGYAPEFHKAFDITVGSAALSFTGYAPSADVTQNTATTVPKGELSLNAYEPSVVIPIDVVVPKGSVAFAGYAPVVPQVIIKTLELSGGDYSSMITWESTEQTNLITDGDSHILICYDDWASGLNEQVQLSGWTTDADHYITIRCAEGEGHGGVINGGFWLYYNAANNYCFDCAVAYTRFQDIQIKNEETGNTANPKCIQINADHVWMDRCILYAVGNQANNGAVRLYDYEDLLLTNCLIYSKGGTANGAIWSTSTYNNHVVENCTLIFQAATGTLGAGWYQFTDGGTNFATFESCVFYNDRSSGNWSVYSIDYLGSHLCDGDYNASEDNNGLPSDGNSISTITTDDFVDYASDDYRIDENSAMYGAGENINTTDIRGATRVAANPSIGAYKFDVVTKTLKPSLGDYSLMSTWESTEQTDLVADGDKHILECDAFTCSHNSVVQVDGWTTDVISNITIEPAAGAHHNGVSGAGFVMDNGSSFNQYILQVRNNFTTVRGIEIVHDETGSGTNKAYGIIIGTAGSIGIVAEELIVDCTAGDVSGGYMTYFYSATLSAYPNIWRNNLNLASGSMSYGIYLVSTSSTKHANVYNNTIAHDGSGIGILGVSFFDGSNYGEYTFQNNIVYNWAADYSLSGSSTNATYSHNASKDSSATSIGSNSINNLTDDDFADVSARNYKPATHGALIDSGTTIADFTDDITNRTRG